VKDVQGHKQSPKLTRPKGYRADFSILDEVTLFPENESPKIVFFRDCKVHFWNI